MENRKIIACLFVAFFLSIAVYAQSIYQKGSINYKKGKSEEAYIQIDFAYPQRFQNSITYITPKSYKKFLKTGKIKNKMKQKLKPKDIGGFSLDNGKVFKTVKYSDLTGKALKMIPKKIVLEQITNGNVQMYKMYSRTTGKIPYELANLVMDSKTKGNQDLIDYIQNNFQLLIQKDSKNPKNVMHINLLNIIGDNAEVKENYDNNFYGLRNQFTERQKMGKYVNKQYEASFLKMLNDYNGKS